MQELVNGTHPCKYIESILDKLEAVLRVLGLSR